MHVSIKRQRGMKKKKKTWNATSPIHKPAHERFLTGVHVSVSRHYVHAEVQQKCHLTEISLKKIQNLHHLNFIVDNHKRHKSKQERNVVKFFLFWPHLYTH